MMCAKCKKRVAVIFITRMEDGKTINEGLCLKCAKDMGLKPVDDMMEKMGISPDDIDNISNEISDMMSDENFSEGGAASLGGMLGNIFNSAAMETAAEEDANDEEEEKDEANPDKEKGKKQKKRKFLDNYCINLTQKARDGKIDNIVGRSEEIFRVIQILNRRTKNNPCLIGEPGVGKTAIAEGLAKRIAEGDAPAKLLDKEIYLLDLTALVAGTQFRGQFESRVKGLIEEIKKVGNIILVIDEVHTLVGTGDAEGSMNAANMLKPALSRGEVQVIGATTLAEYRKYIEKDAALERRFQPVIVDEPSIEDAVKMLEGIKKHYEQHHGLVISDEIVRKAVTLSERYLTDRFLPDKAIDLMDEACSNAALSNKANNELYLARKELKKISSRIDALEQIPADKMDDDKYREMAELRTEEIRMKAKIDVLEKDADSEVTVADLARVIELWTGIPTGKILAGENDKLKNLEAVLGEKIKGQSEAIAAISRAVRRSRAALTPRTRPVSFIFTGPTGVGKTALVKVLANELFDTPETLIRLDMSEFMEKHAVSRIIGSPPGYVGYDEAGQLTEKIRRRPYSVILFDEIEKAHPDVMNILLQILDEGRVTDAHGKTVSFEHTVIIMTSNAGSNDTSNAAGFGQTKQIRSKDKALKALSEFLRPEFMNRVDEIIVFNPLQMDAFIEIAGMYLDELKTGIAEKGIEFSYTDDVPKLLAERSFSEKYGARNVRREVEKQIEDKLTEAYFERGSLKSVSVKVENGELSFDIR